MSHAFISYMRTDSNKIDKLAAELKKKGIEVWLDREQIDPATNWEDAIRKAIKDGSYFIACFSESYMTKRKSGMNEEIDIALKEMKKLHYDTPYLISVLLDKKSEVPDREVLTGTTMRSYQWVDLSNSNEWQQGVDKIAHVILETKKKFEKSNLFVGETNCIEARRYKETYIKTDGRRC